MVRPIAFNHQSQAWRQHVAKEQRELVRSNSTTATSRVQPFAASVPGGWASIGKLKAPEAPSPLGFYSSVFDPRAPFGGPPYKPVAQLPPLERSHTKLQFGGTPLILHNSPHQPRMEPAPPRLFRRYLEQSTRSVHHLPVPVLSWKANCFYGERGNVM